MAVAAGIVTLGVLIPAAPAVAIDSRPYSTYSACYAAMKDVQSQGARITSSCNHSLIHPGYWVFRYTW